MQRRGQILFACLAAGLVAVGDEPAPLERRFEHLPQGCEGPELGPERLERLLDGRRDDLFAPLRPEDPPLAVVGFERHDGRDPHLGGLFEEPLEAVGVLGRRDAHDEPVGQGLEIVYRFDRLDRAAARVGADDAAAVERTPPVGQVERVALGEPQHPHAMARLLLAERVEGRNEIGIVKKLHGSVGFRIFGTHNRARPQRYTLYR